MSYSLVTILPSNLFANLSMIKMEVRRQENCSLNHSQVLSN